MSAKREKNGLRGKSGAKIDSLNINCSPQNKAMSFLANILAEKSKNGLVAPCVCTTGYAGKDFADLPNLLDFLDAVLIDIRFAPTTAKQIHWRKEYLRLLLKDRYLHVPHLGNRISKGSNIHSIQNLNLGIKIITELRTNLLLMCECLSFIDCHRSLISQKLKEQGIETEEIIHWRSRLESDNNLPLNRVFDLTGGSSP